MSSERHTVFVSYSHHDREWLDRVNVHLKPLVRDKVVVMWDDTKIAPGNDWKAEIESALSTAKVAVLLVSADFLASDFIAESELPRLLTAARDDGALILPLILSPSRFSLTPQISKFQSVNPPSRPLIALTRSEQEEVLMNLSVAVERAVSTATEVSLNTPNSHAAGDRAPLLEKIPLVECLSRMGCAQQLVAEEAGLIRSWLKKRRTEGYWQNSGEPELRDLLKRLDEPDEVTRTVEKFADHLLACCAPHHLRLCDLYLSKKKVNDAYRAFAGRAAPGADGEESFRDKFEAVHERLLRDDQISFLPARLLLGGNLPDRGNEFCYFSGRFTLDVDHGELAKVPGASEAMARKDSTSLYGVVSNVFQSSDPLVYTLLRFTGYLGDFATTMILSRKYIQFGSMTATTLAGALTGRTIRFNGIGTVSRVNDEYQLQPLGCGDTN
jgi:hypothetical protein